MKERFDEKELIKRYKLYKEKQKECSSETFRTDTVTVTRSPDDTSSDFSFPIIVSEPFNRQERRWLARKGYKI